MCVYGSGVVHVTSILNLNLAWGHFLSHGTPVWS